MPATLSIITNVFTDPARARQGDRRLGRRVRARHRPRPDHRRLPARALLVGLDLHRQRADRDRRPVLGYFLVPESKDPSHAALDPLGAVLSIVALGTLLWAVIEAPEQGLGLDRRSSPASSSASCSSPRSSCGSCARRHPMLDMHFFENPRFSAASGAITLVFLSLFGTLFLLTQYLQSVLGYSTVKAGAVLLPQAVTLMIFAPLSNVWVQRFGNKIVVTAGLATRGDSRSSLFSTFQPNSSALHIIVVTMLMGLGMAQRHGAVHRLDHGLAAAGQGRRRLGGERHDPPDGRRGRRRGVRLADGQPLHVVDDGQARLGAAGRAVRSGEGQRRSSARHRGEGAGRAALPRADRHRGERQLRQRPAHHRPGRGGHHAPRRRRRAASSCRPALATRST